MRNNWKAVLAAFVVGAVVMAGVPVMAGNDDPIYLGQRNTARRVTKVKIKNGMVFEATKAGVPAATFNVASGPPIAVNSLHMVSNLNAEYVGDYSAKQLRNDWAWNSIGIIPDGEEWDDGAFEITVPDGGGAIIMTGSVKFLNGGTGAEFMQCGFSVETEPGSGSFVVLSNSLVDEWAEPGRWATCVSTAVVTRGAGVFGVRFFTFGLSKTGFTNGSGTWWAVAVGAGY